MSLAQGRAKLKVYEKFRSLELAIFTATRNPSENMQLFAESFVGQQHFWHPGSLLWNLVSQDKFRNLLFWGPPGTGKTTLARLIAKVSGRETHELSSATCSVSDIRNVIKLSEEAMAHGQPAHVLFVDEIHRLNKNQQDVLLPFLEKGNIRFIGATTENPGFSVNKAILSRCSVFGFKPLSIPQVEALLYLVLRRKQASMPETFLKILARTSDGDGRIALNLLQSILDAFSSETLQTMSEETFINALPEIHLKHDAKGDQHYDLLSAFIKSIRASKVQAALYYMARLISGGEPPEIIARRMLISASEDIGNANPMALLVAEATFQAVSVLGYPEARITLSQCCVYLANSPKSNRSYLAIDEAIAFAEETGSKAIPLYLTNAHHAFDKQVGRGTSYINPHNDPVSASKQSYFPDDVKPTNFYKPSSSGAEMKLHETPKNQH